MARTFTKSDVRELGSTAILGLLWTLSPGLLGLALLVYVGTVAEWLTGLGPWGWVVYVLLFMLSAGVGFLPTYGQSALGGWTFGFWLGFPGAMLGFVGGSVIGYLIAQRVSREHVEKVFQKHPKARAVRDALVGQGFWKTLGIVTLIRIPPNSPFAVTNLLMASAGVRFWPYLLGTAIGMAPRTGITVWFVYFARNFQEPPAGSLYELLKETPWYLTVAGVVLVVIVLAIIGYIGNKAIERVTGNGDTAAGA